MRMINELKIEKMNFPGLQIVSLQRPSGTEYFITSTPNFNESPQRIFKRVIDYVKANNAVIISQDVFGLNELRSASGLPDVNWPVTWLDDGSNENLSGTFVWAVSGMDVTPIHLSGRVAGNIVEDECTRFVRLGGLVASQTKLTPQKQAREVLEQIDAALCFAKMDFSALIRTWFYNENITSWYKEFNLVRNKFFREHDIFNGLVPASTGVGKHNCGQTALIGSGLAVQGKDQKIQAIALPSPLQNSAIEYGSSFSRAVELAMPDHRRLYTSGTASIGQSGETLYIDDAEAQVKRTMEVTNSILKSRKMEWSDITRATAYFKSVQDTGLLQKYLWTQNIPPFPMIVTQRDICRDDLLFEIEVDAINY
jgi:enamine deaminase RidA (YjgF/YER057c/UK114 family)